MVNAGLTGPLRRVRAAGSRRAAAMQIGRRRRAMRDIALPWSVW